MATAEQRYPGVPRTVVWALKEFLAYGFLFGLGFIIYALPAFIIGLLMFGPLTSYMVLSLAMFTVMIVGAFVHGEGPEFSVPEEIEEMTPIQTLLFATVVYAIAASAVSGVLLWTSVIAASVTYIFGHPNVGIVIALLYPAADRWLAHKIEELSIVVACGRTATLALMGLFEMYNLSKDLVDDASRRTSSLY